MDLWRVALLPDSGHRRARPRWLCSDGRFSLAPDQAWTVVEPTMLNRWQLVPVPPADPVCTSNRREGNWA